MNPLGLRVILGSVIVAGICAGLIQLSADEPPRAAPADEKARPDDDSGQPKRLADFMRLKLQASSQILEGLAVEDMSLIQTGAESLNKMSAAEKWRIYNDAVYSQFSSEFRRNTQQLVKAANDHNLDQAALKWMAATMNCIECHRYVRNNLVVEKARAK